MGLFNSKTLDCKNTPLPCKEQCDNIKLHKFTNNPTEHLVKSLDYYDNDNTPVYSYYVLMKTGNIYILEYIKERNENDSNMYKNINKISGKLINININGTEKITLEFENPEIITTQDDKETTTHENRYSILLDKTHKYKIEEQTNGGKRKSIKNLKIKKLKTKKSKLEYL